MNREEILAYFSAALPLKRKPVAVQFLFTEAEYQNTSLEEWVGKANFCQMVESATKGYAWKASLKQLRCTSAARAFGMADVPEGFQNGSVPLKLGLYQDLATCKQVYSTMAFCNQKSYGFSVGPLETFAGIPHVVVFVTNPYNAMRMVQGYSYAYGGVRNIQMFGNRAMCTECVAHAFENNQMSISLMCSGTRFYCNWCDDELAVGIPYGQFPHLVEGIIETINPTEPLEKKVQITERMQTDGLNRVNIDLSKSYYCVYKRNPSTD